MHPHAPSYAPQAHVEQTEAAPKRRRRESPRLGALMRGMVVCTALSGVTGFALWLKQETPHPHAAIACRESPLVEARSLKPLLETTKPAAMQAYALHRGKLPPDPDARPSPRTAVPAPVVRTVTTKPVWLIADAAKSADLLRQSLRERGARQMGAQVKLSMLNVAELLAMDERSWAASMTTPAANENQTSALLLTFYLYHLDRTGDAAGVKALQKATEQGMPQAQAVREFVLAGRSVTDFERDMGALFAAVGVELEFTRRGGEMFKP